MGVSTFRHIQVKIVFISLCMELKLRYTYYYVTCEEKSCHVLGLGQATYFSAVCIAVSGLPRVQIQINKSPLGTGLANTTQLIINGTIVDISVIEEDANGTETIEGVDSNIMFERDNVSLTVLFYSGLAITAAPENVSASYLL